MGRKTTKDPNEWMAYQGRIVSLTLPDAYLEDVMKALPDKPRNRIKNARNGLVMDMEVLLVLERMSNEEKGRRAQLAYRQPVAA